MNFAKMEGTGNDFVLIDARNLERDWSSLARTICERHTGVGADGLLLLLPSTRADIRLRMFNPDGTEAEACGNGLRCVARYSSDQGIVGKTEFTIETLAGTRLARVNVPGSPQVDMGAPILDAASVPVTVRPGTDIASPLIDHPVIVDGLQLKISCISMGNPHAVCFLEKPVQDFPLHQAGPKVERHQMFPNRVNFEIANLTAPGEIRARVWERGAGETLSCGSGACAIAVVSRLKGLVQGPVEIRLPGGSLTVEWEPGSNVLLSGPARAVFHGTWKEEMP
ncbi:MAG: diaminopimelate epimerase [Dehalococcoidia bacterium]|nr:diaminopimelate epimerase [Dehalococcoidia bacterium]